MTQQPLPILDEERVNAHFDTEQNISFITYTGVLDSEVTAQLYGWVKSLLDIIGPEATHAVVFDFRAVTRFAQDNLRAAQRESKQINRQPAAVNHPVALIVSNMYQEQMVRVANRLSPNEDRKRIVYSMDEAMQFIDEWHASQAAESTK